MRVGSRHRALANRVLRVRVVGITRVMIILGIILLILGLILSVPILWIIGLVLVAVGAILWIAGAAGHEVAGRRHYY